MSSAVVVPLQCGKDRPKFGGCTCDVVQGPVLLRLSAKPHICDRTSKQTILVMPSAPFTLSKAAYRRPRCHDKLSPLLAQEPESSCDDRWVRDRAVFRRPSLRGPAAFELRSHGVLLNSTEARLGVMVVRVAKAPSLCPGTLH